LIKKYANPSTLYYLVSILILLSGYTFYILVRGFDPLFGIEFGNMLGFRVPLYISNSYATFSHVLALSLFCYAVVGARAQYKLVIILFWSLVNLVFELLQLPFISEYFSFVGFNGIFDVGDLLAIVSAGILFLILTGVIDKKFNTTKTRNIKFSNVYSISGLPLAGLFGIFSIIASSDGGYTYVDPVPYVRDEPVYMTYEELRAPLKIETNRELVKSGKIYIYKNLLIVSEPNKGIHIYDNTNPTTPVHKAFINLPGNLDIAVRAGYLYADSFIDLVVIDINDLNNIIQTKRIESVFPYNAYQAIPGNERTFYLWDKNKGVVIGVKAK